MRIRVGHLYPDYLNIYADRGNIAVLERRAALRGHELWVRPIDLGERVEPGEDDLLYVGGGQDREQALVMVHAENYDAIRFLTDRLERAGRTAPQYHATSRPIPVEREATHRAISLSELVDVPIMIVHVSNGPAMEEIRRAQQRGLHGGVVCKSFADDPAHGGAVFRHAVANDGMDIVLSRRQLVGLLEHLRELRLGASERDECFKDGEGI